MTDIEIAQKNVMVPVSEVAAKIGLTEKDLDFYGSYKAKINFEKLNSLQASEKRGKLVLVTAMTPTAAGETPNYKIIEGANGTWTQNRDGTLVFRANGDFDKFTGIKIDGTLIDAKNYTAVSGSTVITLKTDYLKTEREKD